MRIEAFAEERIFDPYRRLQLPKITYLIISIFASLACLQFFSSEEKRPFLKVAIASVFFSILIIKSCFKTNQKTFDDLPDELMVNIFAYLPAISLLRTGCVCKRWRQIQRTEYLWKNLYLKTFSSLRSDKESWRKSYLIETLGKWGCYLSSQKVQFEMLYEHRQTVETVSSFDNYLVSVCKASICVWSPNNIEHLDIKNVGFAQMTQLDGESLLFYLCMKNEKGELFKTPNIEQKGVYYKTIEPQTQPPFTFLSIKGKKHCGFASNHLFYLCEVNSDQKKCLKHNAFVTSFFIDQSKTQIITGTANGEIFFWEIDGLQCLKIFETKNFVTSLAATDKYIAYGKKSGEISLCSLKTGTLIHLLMGHEKETFSLQPEDRFLFSASYDQTIRIWDLKKGKCCLKIEKTNPKSLFVLEEGSIIFSKENKVFRADFKEEAVAYEGTLI